MKKRFKLLNRDGKVHILRWAVEGKIFGPDWESVAGFDAGGSNPERCKEIVRLLNECDRHTDNTDNDNGRDQ